MSESQNTENNILFANANVPIWGETHLWLRN